MDDPCCKTLEKLIDIAEKLPKGIVYLAGPMRGIPHFNFPAFFEAESALRAGGAAVRPLLVMNPARMDIQVPLDWVKDFEKGVARDLEAVRAADGIALMQGWQDSVGAKAELAVARWLKKFVIFQAPDLTWSFGTEDERWEVSL